MDIIYAQVLKLNAMKGKCKKAPMDVTEMMELAKGLLYRRGVDGLSTFVATEPYSRGNGIGDDGFVGSARTRRGNSRGRGGPQARGGGRQAGGNGLAGGRTPLLSGKTLEEKRALVCRDFNGSGCSRASCKFLHR